MKRNYRHIDRTIRRCAGKRSVRQLIMLTGIGPAVIEARAARLGVSLRPAAPTNRAQDTFLRRTA